MAVCFSLQDGELIVDMDANQRARARNPAAVFCPVTFVFWCLSSIHWAAVPAWRVPGPSFPSACLGHGTSRDALDPPSASRRVAHLNASKQWNETDGRPLSPAITPTILAPP
eukprot:scaffold1052_cov339-Pavlova_lutheri.AAC.35